MYDDQDIVLIPFDPETGDDSLTVGQLRDAIADLPADMPVETGYYTCYGASIGLGRAIGSRNKGVIVLSIWNSE